MISPSQTVSLVKGDENIVFTWYTDSPGQVIYINVISGFYPAGKHYNMQLVHARKLWKAKIQEGYKKETKCSTNPVN